MKNGEKTMNAHRRIISGFKLFGIAMILIYAGICQAADLDITRSENAAGPQVRIEVHTSFERGPRTVTVPRDLTVVDRMLPGSGNEYTDGSRAQYYGLLGCNWSGLRAKLKTHLESNTRETLIFIMRNELNQPRGSLRTRLGRGFGYFPDSASPFFGVGGHNGCTLNEQMRQQLRSGQQVVIPSGAFAETCVVTSQDAERLMESVIRVYETYTGVSRNIQ